jgi:nucleoside-diphosphate-sugar epimerase
MKMQDRILVTGASGFIGTNLVATLSGTGKPFTAVRRSDGVASADTDWASTLEGVRAVVHLAGRHVGDTEIFERDIAMSLNLARQAAAHGVERFVFLSSIKVNGEVTRPGEVFRETDAPNPHDTYGQAKLRIEQGLREVDLPVTVIRVPLVYGPGVRANFRRLITAVERGWPLPLAAVDNRRSLVAVENLCDFILHALEAPRAVGETYLVSDGEDVSIAELLRRMAGAMGRQSRLFPLPPELLERVLRVAGLGGWADRLLGDLRLDTGKALALGWRPPLTLDEGLAATVRSPRAS